MGIVIMLVLMAIVGGAGYFGLSRMSDVTSFYCKLNELQFTAASIKGETDQYLLAILNDDQESAKELYQSALAQLDAASNLVAMIKDHVGVNEEGKEKLLRSEGEVSLYKKTLEKYAKAQEVKGQLTVEIQALNNSINQKIAEGMFLIEEMDMNFKVLVSLAIAYFNKSTDQNWTRVEEAFANYSKSVEGWRDQISNSEQLVPIATMVASLTREYKDTLDQFKAQVINQHQFIGLMDTYKNNLVGVCSEFGRLSVENLKA